MHLLEPRPHPSRVMRWTAPLIAVAATLLTGSFLFWALGKPVMTSFHVFFIQPLETGYGWIRLSQFQDRSVDDFTKKLEEIYKQEPKLKGLVLDGSGAEGGEAERFWRSALRMTAWLAAGVGGAVFLISPAVNRSSFANVSYWVDWANIIGFASACVVAAFFWIWPWTVWACSNRKGKINRPCNT